MWLLTAVRLCHVGTTHKAEVSRPTVGRPRVTGRHADIKVVAIHRLSTVHREVAAGRVNRVHPDLNTQLSLLSTAELTVL